MATETKYCTAGLSEYALAMVGEQLTYRRDGRAPRSGVCTAVRRSGWMQTEAGRFPAFQLLIGGRWTCAFADYGQTTPERTGLRGSIDGQQ